MNLRLTNIQRFSTYDGPGIRTTLFTKGCGIRCPWCSNPENLSYEIQGYLTDRGTMKQYGKDYSVPELYKICMKDWEYYGSEGGVTASGGEALLQAEALTELFSLLHSKKCYMWSGNIIVCSKTEFEKYTRVFRFYIF